MADFAQEPNRSPEEPLFDIGKLLATPGVLEFITQDQIFAALNRHIRGDWSEMDSEDQETNRQALKDGLRIFSAYHFGDTKIWIITEADRSSTTVLLPSEY